MGNKVTNISSKLPINFYILTSYTFSRLIVFGKIIKCTWRITSSSHIIIKFIIESAYKTHFMWEWKHDTIGVLKSLYCLPQFFFFFNYWAYVTKYNIITILEIFIGDFSNDLYIFRDYTMQEDVEIMKEMNLDAYRFSISWPRVLPSKIVPSSTFRCKNSDPKKMTFCDHTMFLT